MKYESAKFERRFGVHVFRDDRQDVIRAGLLVASANRMHLALISYKRVQGRLSGPCPWL